MAAASAKWEATIDRAIKMEMRRVGTSDLRSLAFRLSMERRGILQLPWRDLEPLLRGRGRPAKQRDQAAFVEVRNRMAHNPRLTERNATAIVARKRDEDPGAFRKRFRDWNKNHP